MKLKYLAEYGLVKGMESFISALPKGAAISFGENLGAFLSYLLPKRKKLIAENLNMAFPHLSRAEKDEIGRKVWKNLGRTAVEFVRLPPLDKENLDRFIRWEGAENVEEALSAGKGLVLVTSHFTNWEISGTAAQARFGRMLAIARPMKNPLVEAWVQTKRTAGGNKIALHRNAVRTSLKWIKEKNIVALLIDQNLYTGGVFTEFFGRPAATTTLPALLHIRTGCPVIFSYTLRHGERFVIHFDRPFEFPQVSEDQRIWTYTQLINRRLEEIIRRDPANWFWIHNRWKRKPEGN